MSSRIIWSNFRNYLTISNRLNQPKFNTIQYNKFNNFSSYSTGNNVGTVNFNNSEINKEKIKLTLGRGKLGGELGGELAEGEIVARRLDNEGYFFLKNLRRLKPFLKFLLFQSIPILLLMFLYKYFEQKKLTSIAPITTESDLTKHVISSIRNATSVLISNNNFTFVNNIKLSNISEDIQSLLSEVKLAELDLLIQDFNEELTDKAQLLTINRDKFTYILFEGTLKRREDKRFNFTIDKVNVRFISSNINYTFVKNDNGGWTAG